MAKKCAISGIGVLVGNNVSHANNKTKRRYLPNLQPVSIYSDALGRAVSLRMSARALRTIEKSGGLDAYLSKTRAADLPADLRRLKRRHKLSA
jgi:large subunit ribosomal protein L28